MRTILGILLLIMAVIGGLLPVLQGWMFFAAAIAVLGTDHVIVQWGVRRLERVKWGRATLETLERRGIKLKKEETPPAH